MKKSEVMTTSKVETDKDGQEYVEHDAKVRFYHLKDGRAVYEVIVDGDLLTDGNSKGQWEEWAWKGATRTPKMTITQKQAQYWLAVGKKDVSEGRREIAWNVYRWLKENNAMKEAEDLRESIKRA